MKKAIWLFIFVPAVAFAQVQIQGKPEGAIQIGGNQPGVSSIQGATGDFTFDGSGFSGCSTAGGVTTCTFTGGGGSASLTTNGRSGLSTLVGSTFNIPANLGGNAYKYVNIMSLVGAFTDSLGNVIQPISIGNGPITFAVPYGATQLQLGVNDTNLADDSGSWIIKVNGTNYTVAATTPPWTHTGGINAQYPTTVTGTTSPVVASIGGVGTSVVIQYVSGTVTTGLGGGLCGGGTVTSDANGGEGCAPDYDALTSGGGFFPGAWTSPGQVAGASGGVTSIDSQTGAFTFGGSGVSHVGNAYTFSGGGGSGTVSGQAAGVIPLGTSATVIGAQSHLDDGVTTVGHITSSEPVDIAGTSHGLTIPAGTAVSGAAGKVVVSSDATNGYLMANENNTGASRICTVANGLCSTGGTRLWSCQPGLGDGSNAISSGTYVQTTCMNTTGSTVTLSGISCFTDNSGTSTVNASGHTLGALLTGAITCTPSFAAGTQSANVLLTSGDYIQFTFVADGTSTQTTWVVKGTY